jgi:hypothetical protein
MGPQPLALKRYNQGRKWTILDCYELANLAAKPPDEVGTGGWKGQGDAGRDAQEERGAYPRHQSLG